MANYNNAAYLSDAILSIQKQTLKDLEIIVYDDASSDVSVEVVTRLMAADPRIRLLKGAQNNGPGAARNRALNAARGEWIAIVDSDDFIHPSRLKTLIDYALRDGADIVADDLLIFDSLHLLPPKALLTGTLARTPFWVDIALYIRTNKLYGNGALLGYLKPIFKHSLIAKDSLFYDETLTIGEDYHFMLRLLLNGAQFRVYPELLYFYRRHRSSISHRLKIGALNALRSAEIRLASDHSSAVKEFRSVIEARLRSINRALDHETVLDSLRTGAWLNACRHLLSAPASWPLLRFPIMGRLSRLRHIFVKNTQHAKRGVCILSRQRIIGRTNGSSVYLLDLAATLFHDFEIHFISPSPATLGRRLFIKLGDEVTIFKTFKVRGTLRLGRYVISTDPRRFIRGVSAVVDVALLKLGLIGQPIFKKDPFSIAQPLTREDCLFVARYARSISDFIIADYCFLTEAFPYALRPSAPTAVVMHDLFSSRPEQFAALARGDVETVLSEDVECNLLGHADIIIAIQWEDADFVHRHLPDHRVIVAPMAARAVELPQPGLDDQILFVGSAAAPNIDGLAWFIDNCWGIIRDAYPNASLCIAGSVSTFMGPLPPGVRAVGLVKDLKPLYSSAAVVISPLRIGSGLKIKLIEALSHGKAIVGTTKTLQGVEQFLADAIVIQDSAESFADAVVELLKDKKARIQLGSIGLSRIRAHFTPDICYGPLVREFDKLRVSVLERPSK